MYILECADGSYYTGSTNDLELRLLQHQRGEGANHTKKRLPIKLIYCEAYDRVDDAFYREKQVQGWGRKKKEALIKGNPELLPELAVAYRDLKTPLPEALEGNSIGGFESLSHRSKKLSNRSKKQSLPEALEGNIKSLPEALEGNIKSLPEALEGNIKPLPEALEGNIKSLTEALEGNNK